VVNEKTGAIVIGEDVKISPVAVSYGDFRVVVGNVDVYAQTATDQSDNQYLTSQSKAQVVRPPKKLVALKNATTLTDLVTALNSLGATPNDLINILQALQAAGALNAEIEVI